MTGTWLARLGLGVALIAGAGAPLCIEPVRAATTPDAGRFVWRDLMARDVAAAKRFYTELLGWRFEDTKRNGRAYALARIGSEPVAGIVDVSAIPDAAPQWISFMTVENVDQTVALVTANGGQVLLAPRDVATIGRAAVVADPQGAPLGLATLRREVPDPASPAPSSSSAPQAAAASKIESAGRVLLRLITDIVDLAQLKLGQMRPDWQREDGVTLARRALDEVGPPPAGLTVAVHAHDTGVIMNPIGHQGQIDGGVVQGVGYGLIEYLPVQDGRVEVANFGEYKIPTIKDIPALKTVIVAGEEGLGPYKVKGIGENPISPAAPAIANAIEDAVGVRIKDLPITAEKIYQALHGAK